METKIKTVKEYLIEQDEKLIKQFDKSGFCQGLDYVDKLIFSRLCGKIEKALEEYQINSNLKVERDIFFFAIARRAFSEQKYLIQNPLAFVTYTNARLKQLKIELSNIDIDHEVEYCKIISKEVKEKKL